MQLFINGSDQKLEVKTVEELLVHLDKKPAFLAVAVNKVFVPKNKYFEYTLFEGDRVEIVTPHPGG
ncbi:MAG: thiamine biosynthesis protein ThiS [Epsilonproteobacteria bacterium]|nr:MAG: thiamine biosynthesis protein ThiS [Campylobacterota bacterium]RLA66457.1 MAG: thiamine biosynthesis protein ThiS [Campylobacterota bacterium]